MAYSAGLIQAKRRTENTEVSGHTEQEDSDSPAYECQAYRDQIGDVKLMRAVYGGTKGMRAKEEDFLPRHPMEDIKQYEKRLKQALAFNALQKTVEGLVGMVFRRDPVEDESTPEAISAHLEDVDLRGNALPIFARRVAENALTDGHTWIHVEAPRESPDVRSRAEERARGVRPYWINVLKKDAINWRYEVRAGRPVLTLFAYREGATEPDGAFGERFVERIRVLREENGAVRGELWELVETENEKKRWEIVDEYALSVPEIPVVVVPAYRTTGLGVSEPPLRDLAYEQIEHYRVRSDRQKSLTFSSISVPWLFGERVTDEDGNAKVTWGPDGMMVLNDPQASTGMLESQGHGLAATKEELQDIEARMAAIGVKMLMGQRPNPNPRTATENLLEKAQDDAALVVFAKLLEDALNNAQTWHGAYMGQDEPGEIQLNRDFHTQIMDPQMVKELRELVANELLSIDTLWDMLVEGELLDESFDPEEEKERLEAVREDRLDGIVTQVFGPGQRQPAVTADQGGEE